MNDNIIIYIGLSLLLLIIISACFYYLKRKNNKEINLENNQLEVNHIDTLQDYSETPFTVQKVGDSILQSLEPLDSTKQLLDNSKDILRIAKSYVPFSLKGKDVYEVVFSESIQKEIKKGSVKMLDSVQKKGYKRAIASKGGEIVEHANLKRLKFNPAQVKALAINTLTVVVSQEHLKEIKKELEAIKQSLDRLISFEKNKYFAQAEGAYDYLQITYEMHLTKDLSEREMGELESVLRESISSIRFIKKDLNGFILQFKELKDNVWIWQTNNQMEKLKEIIEEYKYYESLLNLCSRNAKGCIRIMELYGDSHSKIDSSIMIINNLLEEIESSKKQFILESDSYSEAFKIKLTTGNYNFKKQQYIKNEINKINYDENIYLERSSIKPPEKIYLTVENGDVISISKNQ